MKICFFTENYHKGGLDTFLINIFNAWPNSEDTLTLLCNTTHPGLETIKEKTVRPIKIKKYSRVFTNNIAQGRSSLKFNQSFAVRAFFSLSFRVLQYPILFPWYLLTLTLFFRRSNFDRLMVVNGGYPASLLCRCAAIAWRFSGKQSLATFNFHSSATRSSWYFSPLENLIDRAVIKSSSKVVSVSKACLNTLSIRKSFLGCTKLSYIYNGIEDPTLQLQSKDVAYKYQASDCQYCLMLATYTYYKGHSFLFEAFRNVLTEFPDMKLQIYGFGTPKEKKWVADEVKRFELQQHVTLNNFTPNTASLLANASLLVVPSQAYESFGLTIIEAMAFSTPVVTTDVGGMPEVLADSRAGYVCSKDDPVSFANAIKNILGNPVLAAELGRNGRQTFEQRFTASKMAQQYYQLLKNEDH
jgi:glycosyltransferase involved in cell wall biosynthesis